MMPTIPRRQRTSRFRLAGLFRQWAAKLFPLSRDRRKATPEVQAEIVEALSIYLGGNHRLDRLRELAGLHAADVKATILQYQNVVAGRREEFCELTIAMGYVQSWCDDAHSPDLALRREAFANIAAVAHYEPVCRIVGQVPVNALRDPDEQTRLHAARTILAMQEPVDLVQVFEGILLETPAIRQTIGRELRRHALPLCYSAIPRALRALNPREALKLLVSWECALPLPDLRPQAAHPDPVVRVEAMRLLVFLPRTEENNSAILAGLRDENSEVRSAATATAERLGIPNPSAPASAPADSWMGTLDLELKSS